MAECMLGIDATAQRAAWKGRRRNAYACARRARRADAGKAIRGAIVPDLPLDSFLFVPVKKNRIFAIKEEEWQSLTAGRRSGRAKGKARLDLSEL